MTLRTPILTLGLLLLATGAAAQNPCTAPAGTILNPTKTYATLPEHTQLELDGSPRVTDYQIAYFAQGANPATATPVVGPITVAKTAWTLVAGTTNCYSGTLPAPVPTSTSPLLAAIKARRAASSTVPAAESVWSVVSNPFGIAPDVLQTPGLVMAR